MGSIPMDTGSRVRLNIADEVFLIERLHLGRAIALVEDEALGLIFQYFRRLV